MNSPDSCAAIEAGGQPGDDEKREGQARAPKETCYQCGAHFNCAVRMGLPECWCSKMPSLPAAALDFKATSCLCPVCLRARLGSAASP